MLFVGRKRKLTPEQRRQMIEEYKSGIKPKQLVEKYGISNQSLMASVHRYGGIPFNKTPQIISQETKNKIFTLFKEGLTTRQIAKAVNVAVPTVPQILRRDFKIPKRSSHKRKKLTLEQRKQLVEEYKSGMNYTDLGLKYGVSGTVVKACLIELKSKPRKGWSKYRTVRWTDRKGRSFIFKSTWEKAFAEHLDKTFQNWDYETISFNLPKARCYTPDFIVHIPNEPDRLYEVHGWLDKRTLDRWEEFVEIHSPTRWEILGPGELARLGLIDYSWSEHHMAKKVSEVALRLTQLAENTKY